MNASRQPAFFFPLLLSTFMVGLPSSVNLYGNTVQTGSAECFLGSSTSCQADCADQFLCMSLLGCGPLWIKEHPHSSFSLCRLYIWMKHWLMWTIIEADVPATNLAVSLCKWWLSGRGDVLTLYQLWRTGISLCLHVLFSINHASQGQDLIDMALKIVHQCPLCSLPNLRILWCKIIYLFSYLSKIHLNASL